MPPETPDIIPAWQTASKELGIRIETNIAITHPDGTTLRFPVHLFDFGRPNGILVWTGRLDDETMMSRVEEVAHSCGCSFAVVNPEVYSVYDRDFFVSRLSDWGFAGPPERKPNWITETPDVFTELTPPLSRVGTYPGESHEKPAPEKIAQTLVIYNSITLLGPLVLTIAPPAEGAWWLLKILGGLLSLVFVGGFISRPNFYLNLIGPAYAGFLLTMGFYTVALFLKHSALSLVFYVLAIFFHCGLIPAITKHIRQQRGDS